MNTANTPSSILINPNEITGIRDALAEKQQGDECELMVRVKLGEIGDNAIRGRILDVIPQGYKREDMGDQAEPEDEKMAPPIVAVMRAKG